MNSSRTVNGSSLATAAMANPRVVDWFLVKDHKFIALRYLALLFSFGLVGVLAMLLVRLELLTPNSAFMGSTSFAVFFSAHGVMMFHFVLAPAFLGVLGNAMVPLQIGASALAFPRLNRASWHLLGLGGLLVILATMCGGVGAGWMFDAPTDLAACSRIIMIALGVSCAALSVILLSVNLVTSIIQLRAPPVTWSQLPVFSWSVLMAGFVTILASPILILAMLLLIMRHLGIDIFERAAGGDPLLMRQLLWLYGTPAIYAIALPMLGLVSDQLSVGERPDNGIKALLSAVALLSLLLWGQHFLLGDGLGVVRSVSAAATGVMGALFLVLVVTWIVRLGRHGVPKSPAGPFILVAMVMLVGGVLTGLTLGMPVLSRYLHNTYFVTAHVHLLTVGAATLVFLGGLHLVWPGLTGRRPRITLTKSGLAIMSAGLIATFGPLFVLGSMGAIRRQLNYPVEFQPLQIFATAGATILLTGLAFTALSFLFSRRADA